MKIFKVPERKLQNISGGVEPRIFRPEENKDVLAKIKHRYKLQTPFIFYPTSISPRKNIDRVLDAFEKIQNDIPHHLYFTGERSWNSLRTEKRLAGPISSRVHRIGSVPLKDMPAVYSLAEYTIYPSLFEGLGLPLSEAFLCGSPVLTSDQTSLPEVAGDAALIVPAYDTDAIAAGMLRLAEDGPLRLALVEKGKERAQLFT
ncbi:MAG: glycosyltransferase family 4 protein [Anaerolineae bacterium]|jgi:glycosyltransferase involved in cell wall biosynthesis|nr:glycosyltransferase family 4 protein [Anaerolineae bacterium]MBT7075627.1 glycosyltransferase family 4 protein [Anaerolineae bacterium]MBT7783779.1 glycosyltransferase family 4 protein [Anaerolineae bacterium]